MPSDRCMRRMVHPWRSPTPVLHRVASFITGVAPANPPPLPRARARMAPIAHAPFFLQHMTRVTKSEHVKQAQQKQSWIWQLNIRKHMNGSM